ncbi:hypothetical protein [Xenorhabdus szentirmaii]|uniref:hypothetical protein n=1 Tax=Xenorhabdus szentirmaii TaxID=290112 RepID=UPI002B403712|nr:MULTISPECIES: hypothetical protein [unclassified Xenorhabdus]
MRNKDLNTINKIAIYSDMLDRTLSHIRSIQTSSIHKKAFDKTCYQEAEMLHDIVRSLYRPEVTEHDVFFLNSHARYYLEHANEKKYANYNAHKKSIKALFSLVPEHLRDKLEWSGPQ